MRKEGINYRPSFRTRILLAVEADLNKKIAKDQELERKKPGWKNPLYVLAAAIGISAAGFGASQLAKPRIGTERQVTSVPLYTSEGKTIEDVVLPYNTSMSVERQYYIFNNIAGITLRIRTSHMRSLLENTAYGIRLPKGEIAATAFTLYPMAEEPESSQKLLEETINATLRKHHGSNFTYNRMGISLWRLISEIYEEKSDMSTKFKKMSELISFEWVGQLKKLVLKTVPGTSDTLPKETAAAIIKNPPIVVQSIGEMVVAQSLQRAGKIEARVGQEEALMTPGATAIIENSDIIHNATPGLVIQASIGTLQKLVKHPDMDIKNTGGKVVTVILPTTSDPGDLFQAKKEFEEGMLSGLMKKYFPNEIERPTVAAIPAYNLIWRAYDTKPETDRKESRYQYMDIDLTEAFIKGRSPYISPKTAIEIFTRQSAGAFHVYSLEEKVIEEGLKKERVVRLSNR